MLIAANKCPITASRQLDPAMTFRFRAVEVLRA
jgi:hypothetical protein